MIYGQGSWFFFFHFFTFLNTQARTNSNAVLVEAVNVDIEGGEY